MENETINKEQTVSTDSGKLVTLGSLLANIGLGGYLVFNLITGKVEEQKAANFEDNHIAVSDTTPPAQMFVIPADTTWERNPDTNQFVGLNDEGDTIWEPVYAGSHVAAITPGDTVWNRTTIPKYDDGRENIKFSLKPGHTLSLYARIDGILSGQIDFTPHDSLPANNVWGLTISRPAFTYLDTTKTKW